MIKHFITPVVLAVATVGLLTTSAQAQEKKIVSARTICFERVADTPDIYISSPKDAVKILLPVEGFSMRFKCTLNDGYANFYKEEGVNADGSAKKIVVARARVPDAMSRVLFYFVPAKQGGKYLYRVIAMEDGLKQFPLGHTRLLNLSEVEVAFQLGEHVKRLKSGKSTNVAQVRKLNAYNMAPVVCKMKAKDGQWRTISESRTRFTNRKRLLVVSYINSATKQPQLKVYKDIPPEPAPPIPSE